MALGLYHFQVLYDILRDVHFIRDEAEMMTFVLSKTSKALDAEGGSIFVLQPNDRLWPLAAYGAPVEVLRKQEFRKGKGVVGWVAEYLQPVKVENPDKDPRFFGGVDKVTTFRTRSIIASPIIAGQKPLGVIEFLNRRGGAFALTDLELISTIGREVGIVMESNRRLYESEALLRLLRAALSAVPAAAVVLDADGRVAEATAEAESLLGVKLSELRGEAAEKAFGHSPPLLEAVRAAIAAGGETEASVPGGLRLQSRPLKAEGKVVGRTLVLERVAASAP